MEECDICLTKIKKRYRFTLEQSKKHKNYFSDKVVNIYIVKNDDFFLYNK